MDNPYRQYWTLDPEVTFLNHGSYGACPKAIQQRQQELRLELEREPVRFMAHRTSMFDRSRERLATFVGAPMEDLALVPNATHGVNAAIQSQRWKTGDQVLVTDHEYNACRNALDHVAARWGAEVVVAPIPFPIESPDVVFERMLEAVTERTVFCLVDHITSPTALIQPIERLVPALQERGIRVLVDGAHAPGQIPLDLEALGADYYTGNLHKWPCAPKGCAFLYVKPELQERTHPAVISHGYNADTERRSRFLQEFDWTGTFDTTAWATIADTLDHLEGMVEGGWDSIRTRNHALAIWAREMLAETWGTELPAPASMIGTMASVVLPQGLAEKVEARGKALYATLVEDWGIQIPVIPAPEPDGWSVRLSAHLYNTKDDYRRLATVIKSLAEA